MTSTIERLRAFNERMEQLNARAVGMSCDDLEFRPTTVGQQLADVWFRDGSAWLARVPESAVSLDVLEAIASAVRTGRALGRVEGKREIGDFLRQECGL